MSPIFKYLLIAIEIFLLAASNTAYSKDTIVNGIPLSEHDYYVYQHMPDKKKKLYEFQLSLKYELDEKGKVAQIKLDKDIMAVKKTYNDFINDEDRIFELLGDLLVKISGHRISGESDEERQKRVIENRKLAYLRDIKYYVKKSEDLDVKSLKVHKKMVASKACNEKHMNYCATYGDKYCKRKAEEFCEYNYGYTRSNQYSFRTKALNNINKSKGRSNLPKEMKNIYLMIDMFGDINKADYENDGKTHLMRAAIDDDVDRMKSLIKQGADVNLKAGRFDETVLMRAVALSKMSTVQMLLDAGAEVNAKNSKGQTALRYTKEEIQRLDLLLKNGADINALDNLGRSFLFTAVLYSNDIINFLIDNKANMEIHDIYGKTPLLRSISTKKFDAMKTLLARGADINAVNKYGTGVLHYAVQDREAEKIGLKMMHYLISKGANVNARGEFGRTPLMYSVTYNTEDALDILLANGADVNAFEDYTCPGCPRTALTKTNSISENMAVKIINHPSFDPGLVHHAPALGLFILQKMFRATDALIAKGFDVNSVDVHKRTPLMYAAKIGDKKYVKKLLALGADKNLIDQYKNTALDFAEQKGYTDIVALLKNR